VVVEAEAGDVTGLGYSYAHRSAAAVVADLLAPLIEGGSVADTPRHFQAMRRAVRNAGSGGIAACAISAVDSALWDLKARLFDRPLACLLGTCRDGVPVYGSGGFTSYSDRQTIDQFSAWADHGIGSMKMKIGSQPERDPARMQAVREALPDIDLMIDANGALTAKAALHLAEYAAPLGVGWFEEPLSSDDRIGLRRLRDRLPAGMDLAAGEYAYDVHDVRDLARSVDVMQLDATRIGGITGFLAGAAIADAHHLPVSAHTAPALHLAPCLAAPRVRHIEWFHDHVRIEAMLFDGAPRPKDGVIAPDLSRPGHGLVFKRRDAERYAV
jgi:L-alanine-DL-glutamate epimerase-like enolase superfamily enzyme